MTLDQAMKLAMQQHNAGDLARAEQLYRQVLQQSPNHPDALHLLGVLAQQVGKTDAAIELIGRAIALNPSAPLYFSNLAEAYRTVGQLDQAEAACRRALSLSPNLGPAIGNLGTILFDKGKFDEAEAALKRAVEIEPDNASAISLLGSILAQRGDFDGALEKNRHAVALAPANPLVHNNLASTLENRGLLAEAETEYQKAIELNPRLAEAYNNLGTVIRRQGRLAESIRWWNQAAALRPNYAEAQWNLALGHIALGDYARGFPLYEWRFRCAHTRRYYREYDVPRWTGADLKGKSILLYPEQGFGDVIQFARFIPLLAEMGATVLLHLPTELIEIMNGIEGVARIIGPDEPLPYFDTHQAILSLPAVLKITLENLPAKVPYLAVAPERSSRWRKRLPERGLKVGLTWAGRPTHTDDKRRSMPLSALEPLLKIPNAQLFSLQKGDAAAQAGAMNSPAFTDWTADLNDFADTAALIENLDLVISVDTAVAHIAGALGKDVWLMLPFAADYRWMLDRAESPWYPTMRLFRQPRIDDWSPVVTAIREKLVKLT
jgi:Flp pilus assembly protein TadD